MSNRPSTFNTMEVRPWDQSQLASSKVVTNAVHFGGCPIGLNWLECDKKANTRIVASIDNISGGANFPTTTATIHLDSVADTILYSAGCTWLDVSKQDRDFQYGEYLAGESSPNTDNPSVQIRFDHAYTEIPKVVVWFKQLDVSNNADCNVKAEVSDITKEGFKLTVKALEKTTMHGATAVWIAHSSTRSNIASGNFDTTNIRSKDEPQPKNSMTITFNKQFGRIPRVLVALNYVNMSNGKNLRIKAFATDITKTGMQLNIDSWDDSVLYSAGAGWLAIQDY